METVLSEQPPAFVIGRKRIEGRIDVAYYKPEYMQVVKRLREGPFDLKRLGDIATLSTERWKRPESGKFRYIEINDIDTFSAQIAQAELLEVEVAPSRAQIVARENDILVSTTRPYRGAIALITKEFNNCVCSTGFAVIRDVHTKIDRKYLLHFLHSNFGLKQMEQRMTGGNYPAIIPDELLKIWVPMPPPGIQDKIVRLMDKALKEKENIEKESAFLSDSVDDYLMKQLGITLRQVEEESPLRYTLGAAFLRDERWDVEHWKPEYIEAERAMAKGKYGSCPFGKLMKKIANGLDYRDFSETGTKYLRVGNVKPFEIDETDIKRVSIALEDIGKDILLEQNDILLTRKGTFGVAALASNKDMIISSEIFKVVLRKDAKINALYIVAVLNSSIGKNQFVRKSVGAIMGSLSQEAVKSILIPLPPRSVQDEIAGEVKSRIERAKRLEESAREVLEDAKATMERIILGEKN